jgi:Raf kinase inhibitor-like YbhB/YbcL family protein
MMTRLAMVVMMFGAVMVGCGGPSANANGTDDPAPVFTLTSTAFVRGQAIPKTYAKKPEGDNISPPLAWSDAPTGTLSFALVMDDPDAPSADNPRPQGPWVHWLVLLPSNLSGVPQNYSATTDNAQGRNDSGRNGYDGPFPPLGSGPHRYVFTLYALDVLDPAVPAGFSKADLLQAIEGHVLEQVTLTGTYER